MTEEQIECEIEMLETAMTKIRECADMVDCLINEISSVYICPDNFEIEELAIYAEEMSTKLFGYIDGHELHRLKINLIHLAYIQNFNQSMNNIREQHLTQE